ncbi:GNAT family N-acetyltransferase [Tersicoccus sp. Bi-70]|nr:GNAT family N-acetyltransferase [Tersicoccus sp. Bi-70]OMH35276.1 GNAT family N-acetyltransferase [Tersicoccus sp. Bi-70]
MARLYSSVGWTAYTRDLDRLVAAVAGSACVLTAREPGTGALIGLVRTVSDGHTIVYVQDLLVDADHQRAGVGRALLDGVLDRSRHVRQVVLTTDAEEGQRAFYEAGGFTEVHDVTPGPLRSFVRFGRPGDADGPDDRPDSRPADA